MSLARLEELAIAYAQNRTALLENSRAIKAVQNDGEGTFYDLKPYRERYWNDPDVHDLVLGQVIVWHGWVHAVEQCEPDTDHDDCGYYATAKLMDDRSEIRRKGSRIRAELARIGNRLLKAQQQ